ncbi:hypothetical protein [Pseudomonas sp. Z3-8]|uniref:hypothetical protein n=1 Tax=Pseudomonas sp. Z3-8 TaxID=2817412 RepID=UPI003DAA4630
MAQRGYPGIHAGMPTAQCLRSASVVNGASQIKIKIKIKIKIRIKIKIKIKSEAVW